MTEENELDDRRQETSSDERVNVLQTPSVQGRDIMAHLTEAANNSAALKAANTYPGPGSLNA